VHAGKARQADWAAREERKMIGWATIREIWRNGPEPL
jgi:hypothetical protein